MKEQLSTENIIHMKHYQLKRNKPEKNYQRNPSYAHQAPVSLCLERLFGFEYLYLLCLRRGLNRIC